MQHLLAFGMPGIEEWMVIAIIGVIVFGKRLPEVGKNLGKGIVEFKKGLKGIEEEVDRESSTPAPPRITQVPVTPATPPPVTPIATETHKFDPVTGQPLNPPAVPPGASLIPSRVNRSRPSKWVRLAELTGGPKWHSLNLFYSVRF